VEAVVKMVHQVQELAVLVVEVMEVQVQQVLVASELQILEEELEVVAILIQLMRQVVLE